jgi:hypothetical protein
VPGFRVALVSLSMLLGACAVAPEGGLSEVMQRPAERALLAGLRAYDDGQYGDAERELNKALATGLVSAKDRASAHKHLAFVYCSSQRLKPCEGAFRAARAADANFALSRAEAGHPVGPGLQADCPRPAVHPARATTCTRNMTTAAISFSPRAHLLGRHRRRRHGVLRQLPEALNVRAPNGCALGSAAEDAQGANRCSSSPTPASVTCAARLDELTITVALPPRRAALTLAQAALRGTTLLADCRVTLACVEAASFRPVRLPRSILDALASTPTPP